MFFKNFVLMAAFLGLGLGAGMPATRRSLAGWLHPLAVLMAGLGLFARDIGLNLAFLPTGDGSFLWYHNTAAFFPDMFVLYAVCLGMTTLVVLLFIPLGQMLGHLFEELPSSHSYAWDLGGSIFGCIGYSGTAWLGWSPKLGIALVLLGALPLLSTARSRVVGAVATLVLSVAMSLVHTQPDAPPLSDIPAGTPVASTSVPVKTPEYWWSPYHRVHWMPYPAQLNSSGEVVNPGYGGFLNDMHYFDMLDFRLAEDPGGIYIVRGNNPSMKTSLKHYAVPYAFVPKPERVLVLGAGPGNDAAVALLNGAAHVTAVEIDPAVVRLGREVHPMTPYLDKRVEVVIDDARAYMANCTTTYDVVSFGHLDSINLVSSFSSVRTDSYIYTREGMATAWSLVRPGGVLTVSFSGVNWIWLKINALLVATAGVEPWVLNDAYMSTTTFVLRKPGGSDRATDEALFTEVLRDLGAKRLSNFLAPFEDLIPTDDWPFLFLQRRAVSPYHAFALLFLLVLAAAATRVVHARPQDGRHVAWLPFWLGVGFMLVETKSLTELGLLFGSTWIVTAIGIVGLLTMNLIAVAVVRRVTLAPPLLYGLLFAAIGLNLIVPLGSLLVLPVALRLVASTALVFSPLLFAGAAFAQAFARSPHPSFTFGSNLLGAMVGGTLEYLSVVVGFRALWLMGACVYLFALLAELRERKRQAAGGS